MKAHRETLTIKTSGEYDVIDITADVEKAILNAGISDGYALVFSPHTTCGVMVNEKERGLLADISATLTKLIPQNGSYQHDDFSVRTENMHPDETKNAHAHLRHLVGGRASEYIPVEDGNLLLGRWQRIMVMEFDHSRPREIFIQICGV